MWLPWVPFDLPLGFLGLLFVSLGYFFLKAQENKMKFDGFRDGSYFEARIS